jgi:hypothetical protein
MRDAVVGGGGGEDRVQGVRGDDRVDAAAGVPGGVREVEPPGPGRLRVGDGDHGLAVVAFVDHDPQGEPDRPGDRSGRRHPVLHEPVSCRPVRLV